MASSNSTEWYTNLTTPPTIQPTSDKSSELGWHLGPPLSFGRCEPSIIRMDKENLSVHANKQDIGPYQENCR